MSDIVVKKCKTCEIESPLSEFYKHKQMKDGHFNICKECIKEYRSKHYNANKCKIYQAIPKVRARRIDYKKQWNIDNKEYNAKYRKDNKAQRNKQRRERYSNDREYRILSLLRRRLHTALKGEYKSASTEELLGCTVKELNIHIESLFEKGMNWNNQGQWQLDHIKPCVSFNLIDSAQQKECFNYKNLQPLWAIDNQKKSGRELF